MDIDRDRALTLGVSPQQIQDALLHRLRDRQVSTIYTPANEYQVILEAEPQYQRNSGRAVEALYPFREGYAGAARFGGETWTRTVGPLSVNHFGQLPAATISFNLPPGLSLGDAAEQVNAAHPRRLRMPPTITAISRER